MLQTEPSVARQRARAQLAPHLQLPNYVTNLLRLGFDDDDIAGGGSDRLIDALVAWGDEDVVLRRIHEHFDAGADHVCLNVVTEDVAELPLDEWRRLGAMVASEKWR
jgi:probable F420-dependent oxidoreductase